MDQSFTVALRQNLANAVRALLDNDETIDRIESYVDTAIEEWHDENPPAEVQRIND